MEMISPLPPPEAVSAAVVALAASKQPRTVGEGLDLIESITIVLGAADDEDLKADGSHTAYWQRRPAEVELYLHAERPRAAAAAQIGITWADGTVHAARVT